MKIAALILIIFPVLAYGVIKGKATATIRPDVFPVYGNVDFKVVISPGCELKKGDFIQCQLPNSMNCEYISPSFTKKWQFEDPASRNFIEVSSADGNGAFSLHIINREFVGGEAVFSRHGLCLNIVLESGTTGKDEDIIVSYRNTTSPWRSVDNPGIGGHEGLVYVAVNGQPLEKLPAFRVYSGEEKQFRVIIPSSVKPGEVFPVKMISLDEYNNLSCKTHRGIRVMHKGVCLAVSSDFCGRGVVWISFSEEGVYRLEANGVLSNPVKVTAAPNGPWWGDLHFHTAFSIDAVGNDPYGYARDVSCLDFASTTEHTAGGLETYWKQTLKWANEYNQPGEFVTLLALETRFTDAGKAHYNPVSYTHLRAHET